jgi:hypothetical protein
MAGSSEDQPRISERKLDRKVAQQRRTPKRKRQNALRNTATFWSAAVIRRF